MNRNQEFEFMSDAKPADATILEKFADRNLGAFSKQFQEAADALNPRRFANFLLEQAELSTTSLARKEALRDLAKAVIHEADASTRAHLANPATQSFKRAGQAPNRNIKPGQSGLALVLGLGKEENVGDMSRHARYCQDSNGKDVQGRNCSICLGEGFHSFAKRMLKKQREQETEQD
jgi:hypothetical protein